MKSYFVLAAIAATAYAGDMAIVRPPANLPRFAGGDAIVATPTAPIPIETSGPLPELNFMERIAALGPLPPRSAAERLSDALSIARRSLGLAPRGNAAADFDKSVVVDRDDQNSTEGNVTSSKKHQRHHKHHNSTVVPLPAATAQNSSGSVGAAGFAAKGASSSTQAVFQPSASPVKVVAPVNMSAPMTISSKAPAAKPTAQVKPSSVSLATPSGFKLITIVTDPSQMNLPGGLGGGMMPKATPNASNGIVRKMARSAEDQPVVEERDSHELELDQAQKDRIFAEIQAAHLGNVKRAASSSSDKVKPTKQAKVALPASSSLPPAGQIKIVTAVSNMQPLGPGLDGARATPNANAGIVKRHVKRAGLDFRRHN